MTSLPFVVQPRRTPLLERVGSEESGIIEVERRGYLTTGEKAFVQQVQQFGNGTTEIVAVGRRVARRYSLGMDHAYNLVLAILGGSPAKEGDEDLINKIEKEFEEDLTAVMKGLTLGQTREDLIFAACLIKYRINEDFDMGEVSKQHPDIVDGLAALYRDEERRALEAFSPAEDQVPSKESIEEIEKKPAKATRSHSKTTTGV